MSPLRVLLAAAVLTLAVAPGAGAAPAKTTDVTFMTRNVFLGGDLIPLATTPAGPQFDQAATQLLDDVRATDPDNRMRLIAGEIAKAKPDVVGLQEVSEWQTGPHGAAPTTVVTNFLPDIMNRLKVLHASYRVVSKHLALRIVAPLSDTEDVTFDNGDVLLARKGVKASNVHADVYKTQLTVNTQAVGPVIVNRGYNSADITVRGAHLHVANTHLEAYDATVRLAQAKEAVAGPLKSSLPTVLLGDLNSGPNLPKPEDRPPYKAIAAAGFVPRRTKTFNCCFDKLTDTTGWDHIVDWIMSRGPHISLVSSSITGMEKTASGQHPSDHGGVVSVLKVPVG